MYAPHCNSDVQLQLRAGLMPSPLPTVRGRFASAETGKMFEFADRREFPEDFAPDFPSMIYVGPLNETRLCRVLKTVAYVVTDEDEAGQPVVEKWDIKWHAEYPTDWVRA